MADWSFAYRILGHCFDNLLYPFVLAPLLRCYSCLRSLIFLLLASRYGYELITLAGLSQCLDLLKSLSLFSPSLRLFFLSLSFWEVLLPSYLPSINCSGGAKRFFFTAAAAVACLLLLEYMTIDEITTKVYSCLSFMVKLIKHILVTKPQIWFITHRSRVELAPSIPPSLTPSFSHSHSREHYETMRRAAKIA